MRLQCFILAFMITVLAGCNAGDSTAYTDYSLNKKFVGHPANEFFHSYGFPVGRFEQTGYSIVYRWASTQLDVFPSEAHLDTYYSDKENYQVVDNYRGVVARQYCELRIYVDKADVIQRIAIAVDSVGKFSESRCSEIF